MDEQGQPRGFCPSCGTAYAGSRFCRKCGAQLVQKAEVGPVGPTTSATMPSAPMSPAPGVQPVSAAGPTAYDTAASAKKKAKISNLLAIPGFLLFLAGLVLLGIAFVNQNSKSGNLGWGLVGGLCLLVGAGLLVAALVLSILHWRDRATAHRQMMVGSLQAPVISAQTATTTPPLPNTPGIGPTIQDTAAAPNGEVPPDLPRPSAHIEK